MLNSPLSTVPITAKARRSVGLYVTDYLEAGYSALTQFCPLFFALYNKSSALLNNDDESSADRYSVTANDTVTFETVGKRSAAQIFLNLPAAFIAPSIGVFGQTTRNFSPPHLSTI